MSRFKMQVFVQNMAQYSHILFIIAESYKLKPTSSSSSACIAVPQECGKIRHFLFPQDRQWCGQVLQLGDMRELKDRGEVQIDLKYLLLLGRARHIQLNSLHSF